MSFDDGRALIIGIGTYATPVWNAPVTLGDATSIAEALTDTKVAGYPSSQVQVLDRDGATLEKLLKAFDALAAAADPDDTVLVFYAGHGLLDTTGEYNLTAYDTAFQGVDHVVAGTGLSESVLLEKLRAIRAQKLLLIINACFSGYVSAKLGPAAAGDEVPHSAPVTENLTTRVLGTGEGRAVLTACKASQESWFLRNGTLTFFGQAVGDALRGKGRVPNAEYIGLWDFYSYVFTATMSAAAQLPGAPVQQPVMNISQLVGAFPIAISGAQAADALGPRPSIAAAPPLGTAARLEDPEVIEAASGYTPGATLEGVSYRAGTQVIDNSKLIDFGGARVGGNITVSNVAGGDITQITIGATPAIAAAASTTSDLVSAIKGVRKDVAALVGVDDERIDITNELDDAEKAMAEGKIERALVKLDRAREQLQEIGPRVPAAVPLSETVSVLLQRARAVGG